MRACAHFSETQNVDASDTAVKNPEKKQLQIQKQVDIF